MAKGVPVEYQPVEVQGKKSFGESDTSLCRRRDGETWAGLYYRIFWIVILHLVCCIVLAVTLLCALDGYMAVYPHSSRYHQGKYKLMVSDVTTLISSALVVIKLLVGAWTGTIMWNCAFILLQSQGLALSEINWLLASYIPPIPKHRASWAVVVLVFLVVTQQFITPLLSGAVGWGPSFEYGSLLNVSSTNPHADPSLWYWYGVYDTDKNTELMHAVGLASLVWGGTTADRRHCRHLMNDDLVSVNSTISDVMIPCIQIHSITWPSEPPSQLVRSLTLDAANISRVNSNQLNGDWPGNAVIFDPSNPSNFSIPSGDDQTQERSYPAPYIFSGEMIVIMLVIEQDKFSNCTNIESNIFGIQPSNPTTLFTNDTGGYYESCYNYAVVNFTAGIARSPTSTYISSRVIEADQLDNDMFIEPGPWVREATYLMSDTMSFLSAMNTTTLETYNNRSGYVDELLRYSYQASWDALYRDLDNRSESLNVRQQEPRIRASVSKGRVIGWLVASALMTVSSILLLATQSRHKMREIVLDGPTAAFMTDSKRVLGEDRFDLTELSYLTKREKAKKGLRRVRLEAGEKGSVTGYYLTRA